MQLLPRYNTSLDGNLVRMDVSGVGTAIVEVEHDFDAGIQYLDIIREVSSRILGSLPAVGVAVSVIVPLYNEEDIVADLVAEFIEEFSTFPFLTEFLLCENGSQDETREIAAQLAAKHVNVRLLTINEPSYGGALRHGIQEAHADLVVIFNADLWCKRFFLDAVLLLQSGYDVVVGSKRLVSSNDRRPMLRRLITRVFNGFLAVAFGFKGTDTHGMKALKRSRVLDTMQRCYTSKEVFDTELVLKCQRAGLKIAEVPTEVRDTRPARLSLLRRVPSTVRDLCVIWRTLSR